MKQLNIIAEYFWHLSQVQQELEIHQKTLKSACKSPLQFFRTIDTNNKGYVESIDLQQFVKLFAYNLYEPEVVGKNFKIIKKNLNPEKLLQRSCALLCSSHGMERKLNLTQFVKFAFGLEGKIPSSSQYIEFKHKEIFYKLLENELQNLLNLQAFKQIIVEQINDLSQQYHKLTDRYFDRQGLVKLMNVNGYFPKTIEVEMVFKRLPKGQKTQIEDFVEYFQTVTTEKQTKVFQSASKKNNLRIVQSRLYPETTPKKRILTTQQTSQKKVPLVLEYSIKEFQQKSESSEINSNILKEIIQIEQILQRKKNQLILKEDLDLQLAHQYCQERVDPILIKRYGDKSYTSFLRLILPRCKDSHYLAFIRHNHGNTLKKQTKWALDQFLNQYEECEQKIDQMWRNISNGKQRLFKSLTSDCMYIREADLEKGFDKRSREILFERMDPKWKKRIEFQQFW